MNNSVKITILLFFLPLFLAGCSFHAGPAPSTDYYYINPDKDLSTIGRVALVELNNYSRYPQISADLTQALYHSLQKKHLFGVTVIQQNNPMWRSLQLSTDSTYTPEQLSEIRKTLKCDALLVGNVAAYHPFPHTSMGLRLRLVDLADGQLIWAFDQIWDTADKETERRIKKYFERQIREGFAPLREQLVLISPLNFVKFVAYEVAETLPADKNGDNGIRIGLDLY